MLHCTRIVRTCLVWTATALILLCAADGPSPPTPPKAATGLDPATARLRKTSAQAALKQGLELVRRHYHGQAAPTTVLDAAIAFSKARIKLAGVADPLLHGQVQAGLWWCNSRIDRVAMQDAIARTGIDGREAMSQLDQVASLVPDAKALAAEAAAACKALPDDPVQQAMRLAEVTTRFPGTPEADEAAKLAAPALAQVELQKAVLSAIAAGRPPRFPSVAYKAEVTVLRLDGTMLDIHIAGSGGTAVAWRTFDAVDLASMAVDAARTGAEQLRLAAWFLRAAGRNNEAEMKEAEAAKAAKAAAKIP